MIFSRASSTVYIFTQRRNAMLSLPRWGTKLGVDMKLRDTLWESLSDQYIDNCPMAITAENLAEQYNITKEDCDAFSARSQDNYAAVSDKP